MASIGNAWHLPTSGEPPGQASMRFPFPSIEAAQAVTLVSGNQFQGLGVTGNQTESGSALVVRRVGVPSWTRLPLRFNSTSGNNKYFSASIPGNTFQGGDLIEYYFEIDYSDRQKTFVHGSDGKSSATADEAAARAAPFTFAVRFPLGPSGSSLSFDSGPFQARIFEESGHIAISGPDLVGVAGANTVVFAPPVIEFGDRTFNLGRVSSSTQLPNGLAMVQEVGTHQVRSRLSVGGYLNANFSPVSPADLFIRWTQFGCFSPIMQMHRQIHAGSLRQYPWGYAESGESTDNNRALANYRFYATLHTRLFPYIYTYAKQSAETGLPLLRPLVLLHQDDPRTMGVEHTYYFGGDLLVAPVVEPNTSERQLYLSDGEWFDFWSNERRAGKRDLTWKNPVQPDDPKSKIPLFVRRGAVIPLILDEDVASLCDANYINQPGVKSWAGGIELRIYPAGSSRFTMYDDTVVASEEGSGSTTVTLASPTSRPVLLRILAARPPAVRRDGPALSEAATVAAFEAASTAWRFDSALGFVVVKFSLAGGTTRIRL